MRLRVRAHLLVIPNQYIGYKWGIGGDGVPFLEYDTHGFPYLVHGPR